MLEAFYGWYRDNHAMVVQIERDRNLIPALARVLTESTDAPLGELAARWPGCSACSGTGPGDSQPIRIALDFWSSRRLELEGLSDAQAARLMGDAVAGAGEADSPHRLTGAGRSPGA